MSGASQSPEMGILYVTIALLIGGIISLIAGILWRHAGHSMVAAIFTGASAFAATVLLVITIMASLGRLRG
jgi:predicted lysophospholipase L1 biosynthesis ABC-type transport system permease subunit